MEIVPEEFSFKRSRGVVWVCDIARSSKLLNDDATASEVEKFLPRLHWFGKVVVKAAGGTFIKWTGDGFLAWFETPLHRELPSKVGAVIKAIWHMTMAVNVTQLGASNGNVFKLRHGLTFEHDALLTTISHPSGIESMDVTGRAVVLAFRLSGIPSSFPGVVLDATIAKAATQVTHEDVHFKSWIASSDDLLRYFKGERWGTKGLAISVARNKKYKSTKSFVKDTRKLFDRLTKGFEKLRTQSAIPKEETFTSRYLDAMSNGPDWCKQVVREMTRHIGVEMLGELKTLTELFEEGDLEKLAEFKIMSLDRIDDNN